MRILLYPWYTHNKKNLSKYINLYKNIYGNDTVIHTVKYKKIDGISFNRWKKIRSGYLYNEYLYDNYNCIHMISGGSLIAYNQLNYFKNIKSDKIIFDSGHFFPSPYESARFMCNYIPFLNKNNISNLEKILNPIYKLEGYTDDEEMKYLNWLNTFKNNLLIYNPEDKLLNINKINYFSKKTNSNVVLFNSPHAFLLKEKDLYIETIKSYINKN